MMNASIRKALKELENNDYQNRGDNFPRSDIPDCIDLWEGKAGTDWENEVELIAYFKNTDEEVARKFMNKVLIASHLGSHLRNSSAPSPEWLTLLGNQTQKSLYVGLRGISWLFWAIKGSCFFVHFWKL